MAKALKTVGVVLGAVALIATGVGAAVGAAGVIAGAAGTAGAITGATLTTIGTIAGVGAGIANLGASALTSNKPPPARGSVTQMIIEASPPQPYLMGEGYFAGVLRHRTGYGGTVDKVENPYLFDAVVYSGGGPHHSVSPMVDFGPLPTAYSGYLYTDTQLGGCPEADALSPQWAGATGWSSAHKLSGQAAIGWSFRFDKDGKKFTSGIPVTGAYGQWALAYDPRLDDTFPGGSGPHRLGTESTYAWTKNPALHAGTYAFGRYQNGVRIMGIGLPADGIDWATVAAWANVVDANGWDNFFGVVFEPGNRWQNLKDICAAGGGEPVPGSILTFRYHAPAVALDTVTEKDVIDGGSVVAMQSYRDRLNTIVPKYLSGTHNWQLVQAEAVSVPTYVTEDGEERSAEWPFNFVTDGSQAAQLAAYKLMDARELHPIELHCAPRMRSYRAGDCLHLDIPKLGLDTDAIVLRRSIDLASMTVSLTLVSENPAKHAYALGLSGIAPATPALGQDLEARDASTSFDSTGALPGQLLWDDTFASDFWVRPDPVERIHWNSSRAEWAVNIPFAESTDVRVAYRTATDRMPRTFPGKPLWVRITAQPEGVTPESLTVDGEPLEVEGEPLTVGVGVVADFALEVAIDWLDTDGNFLSRTVLATLDPEDGEQTVTASATAAAWGLANLSIGYPSQTGKTGTWAAYEPWMAEYEPTADNTADAVPVMTVPSPLKLNAAADGTITSTLPVTIKAVRQRGGLDVSALANWTAVFPSGIAGTIDNTPGSASRGLITISGVTSTSGGRITVTSERDAVPLSGFLDIQVEQAPPSTGGTSSGGGTSATTSLIAQANSTSYGTINGGPLTVNAGSAGRVDLSTSLNFTGSTYEEYYDCAGKWQWRVPAGVWADVAAEVPDSSPAWAGEVGHWWGAETENYPGGIFVNQAKTGLTAGSPYEFRLLLRKTAGSGDINFSGMASAVGS